MKASLRKSIVLGAIVAAAFATASPASAAVVDPERNSTAITGWWWYYGQTEAQVNGIASANGARVIDIEVDSTAPYTFSAAFVKNTGTYARTWYWYYGLTSAGVAQKISSLNARLIDIERYTVGGQRRFAIVMVKNTGSAAKAWWYYYDVTPTTLAQKLAANDARLIDLESYSTGSGVRYSAVMIRNTGVDAKAWWWYYNVSASFVATKLNANHARLIDLERRSNGNFDVVMQNRGNEYWWWYYNVTSTKLAQLVSQNGARIVDLERYSTTQRHPVRRDHAEQPERRVEPAARDHAQRPERVELRRLREEGRRGHRGRAPAVDHLRAGEHDQGRLAPVHDAPDHERHRRRHADDERRLLHQAGRHVATRTSARIPPGSRCRRRR